MDYTTQLYRDYKKPWNKDPVMNPSTWLTVTVRNKPGLFVCVFVNYIEDSLGPLCVWSTFKVFYMVPPEIFSPQEPKRILSEDSKIGKCDHGIFQPKKRCEKSCNLPRVGKSSIRAPQKRSFGYPPVFTNIAMAGISTIFQWQIHRLISGPFSSQLC